MRNFVIFLQGENFNLDVDGKVQPAGFFATRRIEAETEEAASTEAISSLLTEPQLQGNTLPESSVVVKVAQEMPIEHKNEYSVFTVFPMEEE